MSFLKKQSADSYLMILAAVLSAASVIFYLINCNTSYFSNLGVDSGIVICLVLAAVLELVMVIGVNKAGTQMYFDVIPVLCAALLIVGFVLFVSARVNSIATIMSFERNDQTMADLSSAIAGMVLCFAAAIFNIAGSFLKTVREE